MLDELHVRNLGVLDEARLEPGPGLTVVTGETGAGKTLLLGALRLLLGGAADSDLVGPFGEEATVEGRFVGTDGLEVAAGRRLTRNGRSRAYLDGSVASASALDRATAGLVEIVGQHDQLALTRPSEVRALIDLRLDGEGRRRLDAYGTAWGRLESLRRDREAAGGDLRALERELDLASHQAEEIRAAGFAPGDDAELELAVSRLRNAEELRALVASSRADLDRARDAVGSAVAALRRAAELDRGLAGLLDEAEGVEGRLGDALLEAGRADDLFELDPGLLEETELRLQVLNDLRRKYGPTLEEVLAFGREAETRAAGIARLLDRAGSLGAEIAAAEGQLAAAGEALLASRREAGGRLAEEAAAHLRHLGMSAPLVEPSVEPAEPSPSGADTARLLFASDSRLAAGELGKVASGGELSRLVLALRLAGGAGAASVLVFDEVDAGVGGSTALALGRKLAGLAAERQVLCVTHLPQVAAFADSHYVVHRSGPRASVARVEGEDRLEELSRMLAGLPDSERGKDAAKELLALASSG